MRGWSFCLLSGTLLAVSIEPRADKTSFNFTNLYSSEFNHKSKSFRFASSVPLYTQKDHDDMIEMINPRNTYRGALFNDGKIIKIQSLCDHEFGTNCENLTPSLEYQTRTKIIFDLDNLDPADKLHLKDNSISSYYLSPNMDLVAFRIDYEKRWRHSYKASYVIYSTKYFADFEVGKNKETYIDTIKDVWFFEFEHAPIGLRRNEEPRRKFVFVDQTNNLWHGNVNQQRVLKVDQMPNGNDATTLNGILNGVPDWVYEEEMLSSRGATWWSPNGDNVVFLKFDTSMEENVEYDYYGPSTDQRGRADDFVVKNKGDQYPHKETIPYSKPGGAIASFKIMFCFDLVKGEPKCEAIDLENFPTLRYKDLFARISFLKDIHLDESNKDIKTLFYVVLQNRIGSASSYLKCTYLCGPLETCSMSKLECTVEEALFESTADENGEPTGWIDSSSILNDPFISQNWMFRISYRRDQCNSLEAFLKDKPSVKKDILDTSSGVCIQSINAVGRVDNRTTGEVESDYTIRFTASSKNNAYDRHVYQISYKALLPNDGDAWTPIDIDDWLCLTCREFEDRLCTYASLSIAPEGDFAMFNCLGKSVPYYLAMYLPPINEQTGRQEVIVAGINGGEDYPLMEATSSTNNDLIEKLKSKKIPKVEFGQFKSDKFDMRFNYELWIPEDLQLQNAKLHEYPLLIEIYGGPGSNKVTSSWKKSYTQTYMVSHHNVIVASVDARGSGRQGNKMMHATYKQIGQFEREDASDFAAYLLMMYPALDPKRVGIWGWSFGGYATTHSLLYPGSTFTTGVAVAPLVSRFNYDSMHTERYMDLPDNNKLNYDKCSILNQDLENMRNKQYAIISGTMDDNVHFQNAAQISKGLIRKGIDFQSIFYADEAHSINYSNMNNRHIYRTITRQFIKFFGLTDDEKDTWNL